MKRIQLLGMGLVLVLSLAFVGRAAANTKVAVVNVGEVFQKYQKAKFYKEELDKVVGPKKTEAEALKKQMVDWKKALDENRVKKEDRSTFEQAILNNKRKLEDIEREVAPKIMKLQEAQIVTLFKDLNAAVDAVAKSNGVHLVLAYGDVTEDRFTIGNINRLMSGMDLGSTYPLYFDATVNITGQVIDTLNSHYVSGGGGGTKGTPVSRPGM